ncbi:MAG: YbaB/EbfC family nucleoid-associated protein [Oscillospiraceae bacterium]|nr:YbaB/EbfC family nucleoid-associated protein [Oscillospiraceae bacterium]
MKARLPDGYGKGMGGMNSMIKQAQKMQEDIQELQEKLNEKEYTVSASGGMIELVMTGAKELKSVKLDPEVVDKDSIEDLEDVIVAGVNAVINKIEEDSKAEMDKLTGGMNIPGMF